MHMIVAILAALISITASAVDIEASIGVSKFDQTNGVFYYNDMYHKVDTTSPSGSLGVAGYIHGQRIRAGYQYFGRVTQESTLYTSMEGGYCPDKRPECGQAFLWKGRGTFQALYLQWEPEYKRGPWRMFADIGPMLIKARFQEYQINGLSPGLTVDSPDEYLIKWLGVAVGVEYRGVAIVYQHQPVSSSSEITFSTRADTISLRARF